MRELTMTWQLHQSCFCHQSCLEMHDGLAVLDRSHPHQMLLTNAAAAATAAAA
jgi:hypothetical protein